MAEVEPVEQGRAGGVLRRGGYRVVVPSGSRWHAAVVGATALALGLGALLAIWLLARPLALLFAAIVLAEALAPAVAWLSRWMPRVLAVLIVYLLLLLVIGLVGWLVVPPLVIQAWQFIREAPAYIQQVQAWVETWTPLSGERLAGALQSRVDVLIQFVAEFPLALLSVVAEVLLVLVTSIYWLLGAPALHRFLLSVVPEARKARVEEVLGKIGSSMGGYYRGVAINGVIVASLSYSGLLVIGFDYPLVLALLAGVAELVPIVGPVLVAIPAVGLAFLESPTQALIVLVFYTVLQQFEGNVLMPKVMQQQTDIPPVLGLFALTAGAALGGILGALIALPLAGALKVLTVEVVAPAVRHWLAESTVEEGRTTPDGAPLEERSP